MSGHYKKLKAMTKKLEDEQRTRKAYAAAGERSQRMFNFRIDLENYEHVQKQTNKGRYINELIRKDREKE